MDEDIKEILDFLLGKDPEGYFFDMAVYGYILTIELLTVPSGLESFNITKEGNTLTLFGHYNLPDDHVLVNTDKNPREDITGLCPQQIFNIMMKMFKDDHGVDY